MTPLDHATKTLERQRMRNAFWIPLLAGFVLGMSTATLIIQWSGICD